VIGRFCVAVMTLAVVALVVAARADEPATRPGNVITVGKDTTHATGPVRPDGTVDYVAALNQRMAAGVTPQSNAAVALLRAMGPKAFRIDAADDERFRHMWPMLGIGPLPLEGAYYVPPELFVPPAGLAEQAGDVGEQIDAIHLKHSKLADHPVLAEWARTQDAAITRIAEATRLPRLYLPYVSHSDPATLLSAVGRGASGLRTAANALGYRATLRLAAGDFEGYREDALAVARLAQLARQRPTFVEQLVAVGIDAYATTLLTGAAAAEHVNAAQARRLTADLDAMPAPASVAVGIDLGERYIMLDFVGLAARHGWARAAGMVGGRGKTGEQRMVFAGKQNRDWDAVLKKVNGRYDRMVAVLDVPTYAERRKRGEALDRELEEFYARLHSPLGVLAPPEDRFLMLLVTPVLSAVTVPQKLAVERDLARVAFALAAYKADRGAYPKALAELVPAYLAKPPGDAFTESHQPLLYEPNDAGGYRLASVGYDGKDDRTLADGQRDWRGKDIVITGGPQPKPPQDPALSEGDEPPG
jgi:hypothetical protein